MSGGNNTTTTNKNTKKSNVQDVVESESTTTFDCSPSFSPPRDKEEFEITRGEFEKIKEALKKEGFRKLLVDYVKEVQDHENQKTYQSEVRQLEREHGNVVHFLNPVPGYVLKTSVNGEKKGFINICVNPLIRKPTKEERKGDGDGRSRWSIPYAQSPARDDVDKAGQFCQVYDVIFHPEALHLAQQSSEFREKIEQIALEGVESNFNIKLDRINVKKPKMQYKGSPRATVIRYKIGEAPPSVLDTAALKDEIPPQSFIKESVQQKNKNNEKKAPPSSSPSDSEEPSEWTAPRYSLKYRSHVDLQDCCIDNQRSGRSSKSIPDEVILTIDLPLLNDSSTLDADVHQDGWTFELKSNRKAFYHLKMKLPFKVHPELASAKFDKDNRKLFITMKTIQEKKNLPQQSSDEIEVFDDESESEGSDEITSPTTENKKKLVEEIIDIEQEKENDPPIPQEPDVGYESTGSNENLPTIINGNIIVNSILKGSPYNPRCRSMSESWIHERWEHDFSKTKSLHMKQEEDYNNDGSLESFDGNDNESNENLASSNNSNEKTVRFSDQVQKQLYRSNSSILGQRKKNQKKNKNKRKNRERHNSASSVDDHDHEDDDDDEEEKLEPLSNMEIPSSRSRPQATAPQPIPGSGRNHHHSRKKNKPCKAMSLE